MTAESFLVFQRGGYPFALSLKVLERVERAHKIYPVPRPAPGVEGVLLRLGELVPVLHTRLPPCLNETPEEYISPRLVVVRGARPYSFRVDHIEGMAEGREPTETQRRRLEELPPPPGDLPLHPVMIGERMVWSIDKLAEENRP